MKDNNKQDIETGTNIKEKSRFLHHIERWKSLYEIIGVILVVGVSTWSVRVSHDALRIQDSDFQIYKRPYVILENPRFTGKTTYDSVRVTYADGSSNTEGKVFQNSITVTIKNISEIPAQRVHGNAFISVGEQRNRGPIEFSSSVVVKGSDIRYTVGLPEDWHKAAVDGAKKFEVDYLISYSGMLSESQTSYQTNVKILYYPESKEFGFIKYDIK
ncbi:MAG: hypothetical protein AABY38_08575 [Planctomycetota bacterium]